MSTTNFTNTYSTEYYNHNHTPEQADQRKLRMTLRSSGVNTTDWQVNNITGYYMGIGIGKMDLNETDYVTCEYIYNSTAERDIEIKDSLICVDRFAISNSEYNIDDL